MTDVRTISRASRAAAADRGDCTLCCAKPAVKGKRRCAECAARYRSRGVRKNSTVRIKRVRFCVECQRSNAHRADCPQWGLE